jgi:hypothetical protein
MVVLLPLRSREQQQQAPAEQLGVAYTNGQQQ